MPGTSGAGPSSADRGHLLSRPGGRRLPTGPGHLFEAGPSTATARAPTCVAVGRSITLAAPSPCPSSRQRSRAGSDPPPRVRATRGRGTATRVEICNPKDRAPSPAAAPPQRSQPATLGEAGPWRPGAVSQAVTPAAGRALTAYWALAT